jgi:hypothetical protein
MWYSGPSGTDVTDVAGAGNNCTAARLSRQAELATAAYAKRVKASEQDLRKLKLARHDFHGERSYWIAPNCST